MTRRGLAAAGLATAGVLAASGLAFAFWTADATGNAHAYADTMKAGNKPTVAGTATPGAVAVSWAASTTVGGNPVTGYVVKRYRASDAELQTVATGTCAGTVSTITCEESGVPTGTWYYTVTPLLGNWQGAASAASDDITVDATAPTVTGVSSTTAAGSYKAGGTISITIGFSEPVVVTGTPQLALNRDGTAFYAGG
jgi:ABC-type proline/glycine betaine transport system substrate-binding protein